MDFGRSHIAIQIPRWAAVGVTWLPLHGQQGSDRLLSGQALTPGQSLVSRPSGKYELAMQGDGNVVLYNRDPAARDHALWDTTTDHGRGHTCWGARATMQADGNFVVYNVAGKACWATGTNGHAGAALYLQDDGNLVMYSKGIAPNAQGRGAIWSSKTQGGHRPPNGSFLDDIGKAVSSAVTSIPGLKQTVNLANKAIAAVEKVPVLGQVLDVTMAVTPVGMVRNIASGARIDKALVKTLTDRVQAVHEVAPYAAMVASFVPGIGSGVAAALAAADALSQGRSIDDAALAAVRNAIPGGQIAQAAFDMATKVAKGENVGTAALETARAQLPPGAQQAFDVGVAMIAGKKIQDVLVTAVSSFAPAQLQSIMASGAQALAATKGLGAIASQIATDPLAKNGFQLGAGLLAQKSINEPAVRAVRSKLTGSALAGFDAALKTQEPHFSWLRNIATTAAQNVVARQVATSAPVIQHAAQTAAANVARVAPKALPPRLLPMPSALPGLTLPTRQVAGGECGCSCDDAAAVTGEARRAFLDANHLLDRAEQGDRRARARVAEFARRGRGSRAARVLQTVGAWRASLRAQQESVARGCAVQGMVGGLELPPSPIPNELLAQAGVPMGSY